MGFCSFLQLSEMSPSYSSDFETHDAKQLCHPMDLKISILDKWNDTETRVLIFFYVNFRKRSFIIYANNRAQMPSDADAL